MKNLLLITLFFFYLILKWRPAISSVIVLLCFSSLSTGLNSMAAVVLEDFWKPFFKELSHTQTQILIRAVVVILGVISMGNKNALLGTYIFCVAKCFFVFSTGVCSRKTWVCLTIDNEFVFSFNGTTYRDLSYGSILPVYWFYGNCFYVFFLNLYLL